MTHFDVYYMLLTHACMRNAYAGTQMNIIETSSHFSLKQMVLILQC